MILARVAARALAVVLAGGCASTPARRDVPAVITSPTAASRSELLRIVRDAVNGAPVVLADDALTRESTLTVERARPRDAGGIPLQGRELGLPERFRLVANGTHCLLLHERTGKRTRLRNTTCAPATPAHRTTS